MRNLNLEQCYLEARGARADHKCRSCALCGWNTVNMAYIKANGRLRKCKDGLSRWVVDFERGKKPDEAKAR